MQKGQDLELAALFSTACLLSLGNANQATCEPLPSFSPPQKKFFLLLKLPTTNPPPHPSASPPHNNSLPPSLHHLPTINCLLFSLGLWTTQCICSDGEQVIRISLLVGRGAPCLLSHMLRAPMSRLISVVKGWRVRC